MSSSILKKLLYSAYYVWNQGFYFTCYPFSAYFYSFVTGVAENVYLLLKVEYFIVDPAIMRTHFHPQIFYLENPIIKIVCVLLCFTYHHLTNRISLSYGILPCSQNYICILNCQKIMWKYIVVQSEVTYSPKLCVEYGCWITTPNHFLRDWRGIERSSQHLLVGLSHEKGFSLA